MAYKRNRSRELPKNLILVSSAIIAILLIIIIFKVKGGLIGIVLGAITVVALIYWLKEVKRIFREESAAHTENDWLYEFIEMNEDLIFIASVPGPPREVKVRVVDSTMEIRGGGNFIRRIEMPRNTKIIEKSYSNGVLRIRMRRTSVSNREVSTQEL